VQSSNERDCSEQLLYLQEEINGQLDPTETNPDKIVAGNQISRAKSTTDMATAMTISRKVTVFMNDG
jgi:hypothetical protein